MNTMTAYLSLTAAVVAMIMSRTAYRAIRVITRFSEGPDHRAICGIHCTRVQVLYGSTLMANGLISSGLLLKINSRNITHLNFPPRLNSGNQLVYGMQIPGNERVSYCEK